MRKKENERMSNRQKGIHTQRESKNSIEKVTGRKLKGEVEKISTEMGELNK